MSDLEPYAGDDEGRADYYRLTGDDSAEGYQAHLDWREAERVWYEMRAPARALWGEDATGAVPSDFSSGFTAGRAAARHELTELRAMLGAVKACLDDAMAPTTLHPGTRRGFIERKVRAALRRLEGIS